MSYLHFKITIYNQAGHSQSWTSENLSYLNKSKDSE